MWCSVWRHIIVRSKTHVELFVMEYPLIHKNRKNYYSFRHSIFLEKKLGPVILSLKIPIKHLQTIETANFVGVFNWGFHNKKKWKTLWKQSLLHWICCMAHLQKLTCNWPSGWTGCRRCVRNFKGLREKKFWRERLSLRIF